MSAVRRWACLLPLLAAPLMARAETHTLVMEGMQIKPATARMMGYTGSIKDLYEPETNIKFGMKYLAKAQELSDGTTCGTILKYNAGHAAKRMNPVSKRYCGKVKNILDWL